MTTLPLHPGFVSTCDRHPDQPFTGFCASCLRERLAGLEPVDPKPAASSAVSALKSIFFKAAAAATGGASGASGVSGGGSSLLHPELRRSKSFSGSRGDGGSKAAAAFEPQRRSCEVRGRSSLWSLFHNDDRHRVIRPAAAAIGGEIEVEQRMLGFPPPSILERDEDTGDEIRPADPSPVISVPAEIAEEEDEVTPKKMKEHIDLETHAKKPPPAAGSLWLAASVFSRKLQKWRRKQKLKKITGDGDNVASTQPEKTPKSSHRFRETQSEVAVDAFGRRSCDIDPRFSLDAGRMSVDEPRFSWDRPRASWDGHLIGGRPMFGAGSRLPPMLALGEDVRNPVIERWDGRIPVEEDATIPGGSVQTRDYYLDSSSRRRSLDRSNSSRKQSFEFSEVRSVANARVSPAFFHGVKLDRDSRELSFHSLRGDSRELSSNSVRVDRAESFESAFRDPEKEGPKKKSRRWGKGWSIWGLIYRRGSSKGGAGVNEVERTVVGAVPEQVYNGKIFRSNSSVSLRSSIYSNNSGFGSMRRSNADTNGNAKRRNGEVMVERSRSARFSPGHVDNGLLRLYLTPSQGGRRNSYSGKSRHNTSYSIAKTVVGL